MEILKEHPTPWRIVETSKGECIKDANGKIIVSEHKNLYISDLLEFVNNSARPRITDTKCECGCGWQGIVSDCVIDADGDSRFSCPICSRFIQVIA